MKRKLTTCFAAAALLGISVSLAQEERKPEPPVPPVPPPGAERPPLPPGEGRDRPDSERGPRPPRPPQDGDVRERPDRSDRPDRADRPDGPDRPDRPERPRMQRPRDGANEPGPRDGRFRDDRRPEGERRFDGERPDGGDRRPERPDRQDRPDGERRGGRESVEVQRKPTPYLGVVSVPTPAALNAQLGLPEGFGLVVDEVLPDSPAKTAGLQRYDVLKMLNDQQLVSPEQLARLVRGLGKDTEATLTIVRKGQEQKLTIKVGEKMLPAQGAFKERIGGSRGFEINPEQAEDVRRRMEERFRERGGGSDSARPMQERLRGFQERMRAYQEALRKHRQQMEEWRKNPTGEPPQLPAMPEVPSGQPPSEPSEPQKRSEVRPADLLREIRPGAGGNVRADWTDGTSRWDASRARAKMRDHDGEIEVGIKEGQRVLTVKGPNGDVVFSGPVDTPEQRNAVPERIRGKLPMLAPPPPRPDGDREGAAPVRRPPMTFDRPASRDAGIQ